MKNVDFIFCRVRLYVLTAIVFVLLPILVLGQPNVAVRETGITGLTQPMQLVNAGDGSGRIFIAERGGKVKAYSKDYVYLDDYLDISTLVNLAGEGGLLSIAFHPDFKNNRCFFVHYVDKFTHLITKRYTASSAALNKMDDILPIQILSIDHPQQNHFGGEMHFGQDGTYISQSAMGEVQMMPVTTLRTRRSYWEKFYALNQLLPEPELTPFRQIILFLLTRICLETLFMPLD